MGNFSFTQLLAEYPLNPAWVAVSSEIARTQLLMEFVLGKFQACPFNSDSTQKLNDHAVAELSAEYVARHFFGFSPRQGPANPSGVGVHFFGINCSFECSRDRHCHGTRKCPYTLSSDKL